MVPLFPWGLMSSCAIGMNGEHGVWRGELGVPFLPVLLAGPGLCMFGWWLCWAPSPQPSLDACVASTLFLPPAQISQE